MEINTKYNIGDLIYWLDVRDGVVQIKHDPIKSIKIGGKVWDKYEISYTTRAERDVYIDFDKAKKAAIERQKEINKRALEIVENGRCPA